MTYLSQATLPVSVALHTGFTDGYAWHQGIWGSFPGKPDEKRRFLFRIDKQRKIFRVLLLSVDEPVSTRYLVWQSKNVLDGFLEHELYRFAIKANPTMRRSSDKRRLAIYDESRLQAWFERKATDGGFTTESLSIGAPIAEAFVKNGKRGKHVAVEYEGVLRVVDRNAFVSAFHSGIGAAKGFGYGLLMLQPIH